MTLLEYAYHRFNDPLPEIPAEVRNRPGWPASVGDPSAGTGDPVDWLHRARRAEARLADDLSAAGSGRGARDSRRGGPLIPVVICRDAR